MSDTLDRLKILINSSTPILVMETSEEKRAVNAVRAACSELNMAVFEWSIADGLVRSGTNAPVPQPQYSGWQSVRTQPQARTLLSPGATEAERLTRAVMSSIGSE